MPTHPPPPHPLLHPPSPLLPPRSRSLTERAALWKIKISHLAALLHPPVCPVSLPTSEPPASFFFLSPIF